MSKWDQVMWYIRFVRVENRKLIRVNYRDRYPHDWNPYVWLALISSWFPLEQTYYYTGCSNSNPGGSRVMQGFSLFCTTPHSQIETVSKWSTSPTAMSAVFIGGSLEHNPLCLASLIQLFNWVFILCTWGLFSQTRAQYSAAKETKPIKEKVRRVDAQATSIIFELCL